MWQKLSVWKSVVVNALLGSVMTVTHYPWLQWHAKALCEKLCPSKKGEFCLLALITSQTTLTFWCGFVLSCHFWSTRCNFFFPNMNHQLINQHRRGFTILCRSIEDPSLSPQPHLAASPSKRAFDEELFLRALCEEDSEEDYTEADPVLDDLYFRRVRETLRQTSMNPSYDRFLPRYWTPEEEVRVRTIYLGSQKRPWYRKMQGLRSVGCFYCFMREAVLISASVKALKNYSRLTQNKADAADSAFSVFLICRVTAKVIL